jgi:hypothetical protein
MSIQNQYYDEDFDFEPEEYDEYGFHHGSKKSYCFKLMKDFPNFREVVLFAVTKCGSSLQMASPEFKKDKQIVLAAVTNDGSALQYADESLQEDIRIVQIALKKSGNLNVIAEKLQEKGEFVLEALKSKYFNPNQFPEKFRSNKEFCLKALKLNASIYPILSEDLRKDLDFTLEAIKKQPNLYSSVPKELMHEKRILQIMLKVYPRMIENLPKEVKKDKKLIKIAIKGDPSNILTLGIDSDKELFLLAAKNLKPQSNVSSLLQKSNFIIRDDDEIAKEFSKCLPMDYMFFSDRLRLNQEYALEYLKKNSNFSPKFHLENMKVAWNAIPNELREDVEFILKVFEVAPEFVNLASEKMKNEPIVIQKANEKGIQLIHESFCVVQ